MFEISGFSRMPENLIAGSPREMTELKLVVLDGIPKNALLWVDF